ncbi:MAG: multidrug ABC transporter [Eubacteriales bacterium]
MKWSQYDFLAFIGVTVAAISQVLLKKGANKQYGSFMKEYCNVLVISGYGLMVLSTMFGVWAYRGMEYMNGPMIESLGYIIVMGLSYIIFREKITRRKVLGTGCILSGILLYYLL